MFKLGKIKQASWKNLMHFIFPTKEFFLKKATQNFNKQNNNLPDIFLTEELYFGHL